MGGRRAKGWVYSWRLARRERGEHPVGALRAVIPRDGHEARHVVGDTKETVADGVTGIVSSLVGGSLAPLRPDASGHARVYHLDVPPLEGRFPLLRGMDMGPSDFGRLQHAGSTATADLSTVIAL